MHSTADNIRTQLNTQFTHIHCNYNIMSAQWRSVGETWHETVSVKECSSVPFWTVRVWQDNRGIELWDGRWGIGERDTGSWQVITQSVWATGVMERRPSCSSSIIESRTWMRGRIMDRHQMCGSAIMEIYKREHDDISNLDSNWNGKSCIYRQNSCQVYINMVQFT